MEGSWSKKFLVIEREREGARERERERRRERERGGGRVWCERLGFRDCRFIVVLHNSGTMDV